MKEPIDAEHERHGVKTEVQNTARGPRSWMNTSWQETTYNGFSKPVLKMASLAGAAPVERRLLRACFSTCATGL